MIDVKQQWQMKPPNQVLL
jgi:hypothetical protein